MSSALHSRVRRSRKDEAPNSQNRSQSHTSARSSSSAAKKRNNRRTVKRFLCLCGTLFVFLGFIAISFSSVGYHEAKDTTALAFRPIMGNMPPMEHTDPDGTFAGYPVYHRKLASQDVVNTPYTLLNCVGENWQRDNWKHRSCHFTFFCFNMTSRAFQVYPRHEDFYLKKWSRKVALMDVSESLLTNTTFISLGGINLKWGTEGIQRLQWFPKIMTTPPPTEFYALPPQVVLVPYHSLAGWNPGHLVWDEFLPIWSLVDLFQLPDQEILPLRYVLEDGEGLWASCDAPARQGECRKLQEKFWPLFNNQSKTRRTTLTTQRDVTLEVNSPKTDLVCAKNGVAGIGDLTDHGLNKLHGWHTEDYQSTHNHGRGGRLWKFRNFCLNNLGIPTDSSARRSKPFRIVISIQSSTNPMRNLDFTLQRRLLEHELRDQNAKVTTVVLKDMSLHEQIQLATDTNVFISGCGGGAVTATFLPQGATAIIFFNEAGGRRENKGTGLPARLDWDLFNHLSYIRVLWFPSTTMNKKHDLKILLEIVKDTFNRHKSRSADNEMP